MTFNQVTIRASVLSPSWLSHREGGVNYAFPSLAAFLLEEALSAVATVRRPIGRVGRGVKNAASSANQVAARSLPSRLVWRCQV